MANNESIASKNAKYEHNSSRITKIPPKPCLGLDFGNNGHLKFTDESASWTYLCPSHDPAQDLLRFTPNNIRTYERRFGHR
jgi:hypothetical protein